MNLWVWPFSGLAATLQLSHRDEELSFSSENDVSGKECPFTTSIISGVFVVLVH